MALLRLSNGRVYVTIEDISPRIGTVRIGRFDYPDSLRRDVESLPMPLTEEGIEFVTSNLDPQAVGLAASECIVHRRIGCVIPPKKDGDPFAFAFGKTAADFTHRTGAEEDVRNNLMPHVQDAVDWHFLMSGSIVKGLELGGGLQGVLYMQAGEWICLNPKAVNWVITPMGQPTIGISYFNKEVGSFKQINYPDVAILPDMRF
jgi:hypothetical protein